MAFILLPPFLAVCIIRVIKDASFLGKTVSSGRTGVAYNTIGNTQDSSGINVIVRLAFVILIPHVATIDAMIAMLQAGVAIRKVCGWVTIAICIFALGCLADLAIVNGWIKGDFFSRLLLESSMCFVRLQNGGKVSHVRNKLWVQLQINSRVKQAVPQRPHLAPQERGEGET